MDSGLVLISSSMIVGNDCLIIQLLGRDISVRPYRWISHMQNSLWVPVWWSCAYTIIWGRHRHASSKSVPQSYSYDTPPRSEGTINSNSSMGNFCFLYAAYYERRITSNYSHHIYISDWSSTSSTCLCHGLVWSNFISHASLLISSLFSLWQDLNSFLAQVTRIWHKDSVILWSLPKSGKCRAVKVNCGDMHHLVTYLASNIHEGLLQPPIIQSILQESVGLSLVTWPLDTSFPLEFESTLETWLILH